MADQADSAVEKAIARMQATLDELKHAQQSDDDAEPKTLPEANAEAKRRFAQARDNSAKK